MHNTAANIYIGYDGGVLGGNGADGHIDEVSVWSVALTDKEIKEIYQDPDAYKLEDGIGVFDLFAHSKLSNLVAWWRMGDHVQGGGQRDAEAPGTGGTIIDASDNSLPNLLTFLQLNNLDII